MLKKYLYSALAYLNNCSLAGLFKLASLKLRGKTVVLSGSCRGCGTCCRKINLEVSGGWVRSAEAFSQVLRDYPEFGRFEIVGRDPQGFLQFSCTWCTVEGVCRDYENRLAICRNFPDTSLVFCGGSLPQGCGYRFSEGVPFARVLDREIKKSR